MKKKTDNTEVKKKDLGIMLSNWYSGATLLAILLDRHPKLACNGESFPFTYKDKRRYKCSCGEFLDECNFYRSCASHMFDETNGQWNNEFFVQVPSYSNLGIINKYLLSPRRDNFFRNGLLDFFPPYRQKQDSFLDAQEQFIDKALDYLDSDLYLDGTKSIRRAQLFIHSGRFNIRVIHSIRDGRAYCYSYIKNNDFPREKLIEAAHRWNDYIHKVNSLEKSNTGLNIITIRYEDLCKDLDKNMNRLFEFLGLDKDYDLQNNVSENHILGNKMRKSFDNNIIEDKKWEKNLSQHEIEMITEIMDDNLIRYSYI